MRKQLITALGLALIACIAYGGGGNTLASGEIDIAAATAATVVTQAVGLNNINNGLEWATVKAAIVQNNGNYVTTTTVVRVDLDDTTTLATAAAASGTTTYASAQLTNVNGNIYFPCAKALEVRVALPTNDAASTLEYFIYGE